MLLVRTVLRSPLDLQVEFQQVRPHRGTLLPLQLRRPQSHLCVQPFARTQAELRRAVLCMVTVYHSKKKKSSKEKRHESRERAGVGFWCLPGESDRADFSQQQGDDREGHPGLGSQGLDCSCPAHMADLNLQRD